MQSLTDLLNRYAGFALNVGVDLVAILLMTSLLSFRRHWRSDLLLAYITVAPAVGTPGLVPAETALNSYGRYGTHVDSRSDGAVPGATDE